jgi:N-methylhydantoinase A/oxoprolinase/acetone carboxylase beta subunit
MTRRSTRRPARPRALRREVHERVRFDGTVVVELDADEVRRTVRS